MEGPILKTKLHQILFTQLTVEAKGQEYYLIAYSCSEFHCDLNNK